MKQDHRVRLTKLLLREAFLDLLVEKPVAKITVKELCEQANVNRATFYAVSYTHLRPTRRVDGSRMPSSA